MSNPDSSNCTDCATRPRQRGWSRCVPCLNAHTTGTRRRRDGERRTPPIDHATSSTITTYNGPRNQHCCGPQGIPELRQLGLCPHYPLPGEAWEWEGVLESLELLRSGMVA
jgi:hypothetical protein